VLAAPQFWAIALTHFACCAAHSGPIFHMVTHATDQGIGSMAAATALGVSGLASIIGRLGGGLVADRVGVKPTLLVGLAFQAGMIVLYLFVLGLSPWVNAAILVGLVVLVFVPIGYVYPSRTPTLRTLTLILGTAWALLVVAMVWMLPAPPRWMVWATLIFPAYYAALSLALQATKTKTNTKTDGD